MMRHVTIITMVACAVPVAAGLPTASAPPPQLAFRHSWDTLAVAWFSANTTGPESEEEMALIANYSVAVLSWELGTKSVSDPWRHTDDKMRKAAAALATAAPDTEVLMYMQGQLAMDWYEITRALLPPPCGVDSVGVRSLSGLRHCVWTTTSPTIVCIQSG